jgi:hypothetical protein
MWVNYEYAVSYFGEKRLTPSLLIGCLTHIHDFLNRPLGSLKRLGSKFGAGISVPQMKSLMSGLQ